MTYGPEERILDGETCSRCGKPLHHECSMLDDQYFCSDECLGAYLIEKYEDDIYWVDFITQGEIDERLREIHDDQMRDR